MEKLRISKGDYAEGFFFEDNYWIAMHKGFFNSKIVELQPEFNTIKQFNVNWVKNVDDRVPRIIDESIENPRHVQFPSHQSTFSRIVSDPEKYLIPTDKVFEKSGYYYREFGLSHLSNVIRIEEDLYQLIKHGCEDPQFIALSLKLEDKMTAIYVADSDLELKAIIMSSIIHYQPEFNFEMESE